MISLTKQDQFNLICNLGCAPTIGKVLESHVSIELTSPIVKVFGICMPGAVSYGLQGVHVRPYEMRIVYSNSCWALISWGGRWVCRQGLWPKYMGYQPPERGGLLIIGFWVKQSGKDGTKQNWSWMGIHTMLQKWCTANWCRFICYLPALSQYQTLQLDLNQNSLQKPSRIENDEAVEKGTWIHEIPTNMMA